MFLVNRGQGVVRSSVEPAGEDEKMIADSGVGKVFTFAVLDFGTVTEVA